jgi:hypothetical protein
MKTVTAIATSCLPLLRADESRLCASYTSELKGPAQRPVPPSERKLDCEGAGPHNHGIHGFLDIPLIVIDASVIVEA